MAQGQTNKEDREFDEGKCTKVFMGIKHPSRCKRQRTTVDLGKEKSVQSNFEILVPLLFCVTKTQVHPTVCLVLALSLSQVHVSY